MSTQFNCQTVLMQTIQFSIRIVFVYTQLNVKTVLFQTVLFSLSTVSMSKAVLFQTIQFCISTQFSSIWPRDRTLSCASIPGQNGHRSNGNEGALCILQSSSITAASPSSCLVSIQDTRWGCLTLCRGAVGLFYCPSRLGNQIIGIYGCMVFMETTTSFFL